MVEKIHNLKRLGRQTLATEKQGEELKEAFKILFNAGEKLLLAGVVANAPNPDNCACVTNPTFNGVQEVFKDTPCVDKNGTCLRSQKRRIRSGHAAN